MADGIVYYDWRFNDWLGSATRAEMELVDRAIYRDLLDHQAAKGKLPDSSVAIANLAMCSQAQAQRFLDRWGDKLFPVSEDGSRQNARMAECRGAILERLDKRSRAGRAGAEALHHGKRSGKRSGKRTANAGSRASDSGSDSGSRSPPEGGCKGGRRKDGEWFEVPFANLIPDTLRDHDGFIDTWHDWCEHNEARGKGITPYQAGRLLSELAPHGPDIARKKLDEAMAHGWSGPVFDAKRDAAELDPNRGMIA